jgi:hypothetical protein
MFSIGDKVTVLISKSEDWEMRELAARFGDEVDGTVIGRTGRIVMVETLNGLRLNPFIQDVVKGNWTMTKLVKIAGIISAFVSLTCGLISLMVIGPEHFGLIPMMGLTAGSVVSMIAFAVWTTEDMM